MRAKTTNREVWAELPLESRNIDAKLKSIQRNVTKATTALARAIEERNNCTAYLDDSLLIGLNE